MRRSLAGTNHGARWLRRLGVFAAASIALTAGPSLPAQGGPFDSTAAILAKGISRLKQSSVLVCDVSGPKHLNWLGVKLADDLSESLSRAAGGSFQVADRSQIPDILRSLEVERQAMESDTGCSLLAAKAGATSYVWGEMKIDGDKASVEIGIYTGDTDDAKKSYRLSLGLSPELQAVAGNEIHEAVPNAYPLAGWNGYATPVCASCYSPSYTEEAVYHHTRGKILALFVLNPDGRTGDVRVLKGLPYGLTGSALLTVGKWKFDPVKGPDGQPARVRVLTVLEFKLF